MNRSVTLAVLDVQYSCVGSIITRSMLRACRTLIHMHIKLPAKMSIQIHESAFALSGSVVVWFGAVWVWDRPTTTMHVHDRVP